MKKIVEIKQTYRYFAEVELNEDQIKDIKEGNYNGVNYDHVDKWSEIETEISLHPTNDTIDLKFKVETVFNLDNK